MDLKHKEMLIKYAEKYGVDPDIVLAMAEKESGGNPKARSKKGAMGLLQLMPGTAKEMKVKNPWNPEQNIRGGVGYLAKLLERYPEFEVALQAYNAGPGRVARGTVPESSKVYAEDILTKAGYKSLPKPTPRTVEEEQAFQDWHTQFKARRLEDMIQAENPIVRALRMLQEKGGMI